MLIRLHNLQFFKALQDLFLNLSDNAPKFIAAASSQAIESLNNSATAKAPKRLSYSTTESADVHFACTVAQKNYGQSYVQWTLKKLKINTSSILTSYIEKKEKLFLYKKEISSKPAFKRHRLQAKANRLQLQNRVEAKEGDTYKSNMALIDNTSSTNMNTDPTDLEKNAIEYQSSQSAIISFDIETGGFSLSKDILQISMKYNSQKFNYFIVPTTTIDQKATDINGFAIVQKQLFQKGNKVNAENKV